MSTSNVGSHTLGSHPPASAREGAISKRRAATRDRLVEAAGEVFAERGVHGASVEDICDRADFTRGAFYSNFSSKEELVLEIAGRYSGRLLDAIAPLADDPALAPDAIIAAVLDEWAADRRERERWFLLHSEFTLHAIRDPEAGRGWGEQQAGVRDALAALIERICERRGLVLTVPSQDLAAAAMALFLAGTSQHLLTPEAVADGALARRFLPMLVDAVARGR